MALSLSKLYICVREIPIIGTNTLFLCETTRTISYHPIDSTEQSWQLTTEEEYPEGACRARRRRFNTTFDWHSRPDFQRIRYRQPKTRGSKSVECNSRVGWPPGQHVPAIYIRAHRSPKQPLTFPSSFLPSPFYSNHFDVTTPQPLPCNRHEERPPFVTRRHPLEKGTIHLVVYSEIYTRAKSSLDTDRTMTRTMSATRLSVSVCKFKQNIQHNNIWQSLHKYTYQNDIIYNNSLQLFYIFL